MIASRADDPDDAIEAALQFRLVEIGDAAGQHRQLTRNLRPAASVRIAIGGSSSAADKASDSLPPCRTLSTICDQRRDIPRRAMMSTRMRSAAEQRHAARQQQAEIAAEQDRAVIVRSPRRSPAAARRARSETRARIAGCRIATARRRGTTPPRRSRQSAPFARRKSDKREKGRQHRVELGVEVAKHVGELRQHEGEEEQQHAAGGEQQESGIAQRVDEACAAALRRACAPPRSASRIGAACPRRFADFDQRDIDAAEKRSGTFGERLAEALARRAPPRAAPPMVGAHAARCRRRSASSSSASLMRTPVRSSSARSPVKIVTSSARGRATARNAVGDAARARSARRRLDRDQAEVSDAMRRPRPRRARRARR